MGGERAALIACAFYRLLETVNVEHTENAERFHFRTGSIDFGTRPVAIIKIEAAAAASVDVPYSAHRSPHIWFQKTILLALGERMGLLDNDALN